MSSIQPVSLDLNKIKILTNETIFKTFREHRFEFPF